MTKKYSQTERGKEARRRAVKRYRRTTRGKENKQRTSRKYNLLYPEKRRAHATVSYALSIGRMIRPDNCESCFKECKPEAHHEDYNKPLDVDWLCVKCHSKQGVKV